MTAIDAWSSLRATSYRDIGNMSTKIDEIDDMKDLFEIMESFGLSTKGYKGVDGMKTRLLEYLKDLEGSSKRKVGEVSIIISLETMRYFLSSEIDILFTGKQGDNGKMLSSLNNIRVGDKRYANLDRTV